MFEDGLTSSIFMMVGGLGIFVYGMHLTSDGLQKLAGDKIKWVLTKLTSNRIIGALIGTVTTAVLQSSSFMTVMVVSLVSANLLNLTQAASLIIGANIGTTVTAQIIAFDVSVLALPVIAIGVYMNLFPRKEGWHFSGQTLIGLGLLFLGMSFMKDSFAPLQNNPAFHEFFITYGGNIFLAMLFGVIATFIIQSSAAVITIALASSGMLGLSASIAIVLGSNIGTTLTAEIAAAGMDRDAKRAGLFHTIFNVLGVAWIMIIFGYFVDFVEWVTPGATVARKIANAHTFFNIANVVVFLVVLPYLVRFVEWVLPIRKEKHIGRIHVLHKSYLKTPEIALMQVKLSCLAMFDVAHENMDLCKKYTSDSKHEAHFFKNEQKINSYREDISKYLGKIGTHDLTEKQAQKIPVFLHLANDIESLADCIKKMVIRIQEGEVPSTDLRLMKNLLSELSDYLKKLRPLLEAPIRDRVIALEEDLIDFRKRRLDKIKGKHVYLECMHDIVRKTANVLVMTREI